jgi:histone-lysine N-methyltransferase SUV39H
VRAQSLRAHFQRQKGWGIRTAVKIPKGTFIGVYAGELISEECSELRGQLYTEIGRTYVDAVCLCLLR